LSNDRECPACRKGVDDQLAVDAEGPPQGHPSTAVRSASAAAAVASLVTIATFLFEAEAEEARDRVDGEGIPAFLTDSHTVGMNWLLGNAIGYIKLQVPSDRAVEASGLLRQWRNARRDAQALPDVEAEDEGDEDSADTTNLLDTLRGKKRLVIWLILSPTVLGLGFTVAALLAWLVRTVIGA
jgi:hypothetical protein